MKFTSNEDKKEDDDNMCWACGIRPIKDAVWCEECGKTTPAEDKAADDELRREEMAGARD